MIKFSLCIFKSRNIELLENLKNGLILNMKLYIFIMLWSKTNLVGDMATVIGIFEQQFKQKVIDCG